MNAYLFSPLFPFRLYHHGKSNPKSRKQNIPWWTRNQNNESWMGHIFNNSWVHSYAHRNDLVRMTNNWNLSIRAPFFLHWSGLAGYDMEISLNLNGLKLEKFFVAETTCPLHIGSLPGPCYIYTMIRVRESLYLDHCWFIVAEKRHIQLHTHFKVVTKDTSLQPIFH